MAVKITLVVDDTIKARVLNDVIAMRDRLGEAVDFDIEVREDMEVIEAAAPVRRRASTAAVASAPADRGTVRKVVSKMTARRTLGAGRAAVVYEVIDGKAEIGPVPDEIRTFCMKKGPVTARAIMEWKAKREGTTVEAARKSVESALHTMRTQGVMRSVPIEAVAARPTRR